MEKQNDIEIINATTFDIRREIPDFDLLPDDMKKRYVDEMLDSLGRIAKGDPCFTAGIYKSYGLDDAAEEQMRSERHAEKMYLLSMAKRYEEAGLHDEAEPLKRMADSIELQLK